MLRRMPALARPGVSDAAQAALDQAVLLAAAPARARQSVPDRVLASFTGKGAEAAALADPWAASPVAAASALVAEDPRLRAIQSITGAPAAVAAMAGGSASLPVALPKPGPLIRAEAVRTSLGAAEAALRDAGLRHAAIALDQARAAAGGLVQALAEGATNPLRRLQVAPAALAEAADAGLARLQARAADGLFTALAEARQSLTALDSPPLAVLAPLAALVPEPIRSLRAPPTFPSFAASRLVPPPLALPARIVPSLAAAWPALPPVNLPMGWGGRPALPEPPAAAAPPDPPDGPGLPPYDAAAAGALAGMAAAARLMRLNGLGNPLDWDALARLIAGFDAWAGTMPPLDAGDYASLMQWSGLARQLALLRGQLGFTPWDPVQQPALAEALHDRARWLSERSPWPEREAAAANLQRWLPLVDCAEAYDMPTQGAGALRALGETLRQIAAMPLPAVRDLGQLARMMAALDAMAGLQESFGFDPTSPDAAERLAALARALEGLALPTGLAATGALDRSCLDRLRQLDQSQAETLGLEELGSHGIPLLSAGLPALAALDATRRLGALQSAVAAGPAALPVPPALKGIFQA
jgi:hypothetical protein